MTAVIPEATSTHRPAHIAKTAALVVLFWTIAAFFVVALHRMLGATSPAACVTAQTAAIVLTAFAYMKLATREATIDHALFVGATWLVLAILTELVLTTHGGRGWFEIIGSPASALRNVLMFAWIFAPALFATRQE